MGGLKIGLPSVFTIPSRESKVLLLYSATIQQTRRAIKYPFLLTPNQENLHLSEEVSKEIKFKNRQLLE